MQNSDYPVPKFPSSLEPRRNDPNICIFIANFTEPRCTIKYWNKQATPEDIMQDTTDLKEWICTCKVVLAENENLENSWPILAYFNWYNNDILTSSNNILNLILQINNIPFAVRKSTVNIWFTKIKEWCIKSTDKFNEVQASFPKCDILHAFLYEATLWVGRRWNHGTHQQQTLNCLCQLTWVTKIHFQKRWISLDNHADIIAQTGECLAPNSTEVRASTQRL